jgi:hypothetical protein
MSSLLHSDNAASSLIPTIELPYPWSFLSLLLKRALEKRAADDQAQSPANCRCQLLRAIFQTDATARNDVLDEYAQLASEGRFMVPSGPARSRSMTSERLLS